MSIDRQHEAGSVPFPQALAVLRAAAEETRLRILALLNPKGEPLPEGRPLLHNGARPLGRVLCDGGDPGWQPEGDNPDGFVSDRGLARARFDQDRVAQLDDVGDGRRRGRDARLARVTLARNPDDHRKSLAFAR